MQVSLVISLLLFSVVGATVYGQSPRRPQNRAFVLITLSLMLHAAGLLVRARSRTEWGAHLGTFLLQLGLNLFIPALFLFLRTMTDVGREGLRRLTLALFWGYLPALTAAGIDDLVRGASWIVRIVPGPDGWILADYGPLGMLQAATLIGSLAAAAGLLGVSWARADGLKRIQLQWVGLSFVVASLLAVTTILVKDAFFAPLGTIACYLGIAYAITRYRFMDIRVVVRLGAIYATVTILLLGVYAGFVAGGTLLFGRYLSLTSPAFPLGGVVAVALLFDPLRSRVRRVLDRAFFREEIDIAAALETFSASLGGVTRMADLLRLIEGTLGPALHPDRIRLIVMKPDAGPSASAVLKAYAGDGTIEELPACEDLAAWCRAHRRPCLPAAELAWLLERAPGAPPDPDRRILDYLARQGLELVAPLFRDETLLGLLVLGPKRAQIPYRSRDAAFLSAIAAQAALALQNIELNESARALEKDLHEADKLASLGALASEIAHEVRNPLAVIKTYVHLLPEKGADEAFRARFRELVAPELDRVQGIMDRILSGAADRPAVRTEVRLETLAGDTLDFFAEDLARRRVVVERDWNGRVPPLRGDPAQLRQVFQNLILNAVQAMPQGGRVRLRIRPTDEGIRAEVSDTGAGIPPEQLPLLFRPFATTKPTGTGLGLVISRRIMQDHGGTIRVESRPGEGTTFILDFPRERA